MTAGRAQNNTYRQSSGILLLAIILFACLHVDFVVADGPEDVALSWTQGRAADDSSIVILSSVDGSIHALESATGEIRWTLSSGGSIVSAAKGGKPDAKEGEVGKADGQAAEQNTGRGEVGAQTATTGAIQKREPKRSMLTGTEEDSQGMPDIIPSYERGGGLWLYRAGKLKRVEMTASQIVDASPFVGEDGFIYVGRKKTNLFAVDPSSGKANWVHFAELDNPTCSSDESGAETLIISRSEYTLHARDARTGLQNWNVTIAEFMAHGTVQSQDFPVEHELPLLVVSNGQDGRVVRCHDAESGALRWSRMLPSAPVCAHVWAEQRAVELALYSESDFAEAREPGKAAGKEQTIASIFLGEHQGTLFARPSPQPALADSGVLARLRAPPTLPRIDEAADRPHLPAPQDPDANKALVHGASSRGEQADGAGRGADVGAAGALPHGQP